MIRYCIAWGTGTVVKQTIQQKYWKYRWINNTQKILTFVEWTIHEKSQFSFYMLHAEQASCKWRFPLISTFGFIRILHHIYLFNLTWALHYLYSHFCTDPHRIGSHSFQDYEYNTKKKSEKCHFLDLATSPLMYWTRLVFIMSFPPVIIRVKNGR